jgi:hypothetical protein
MINTPEKENNMPKFGYLSIREMEPRIGRKYSTKYYKQSRPERLRTEEHIQQTILDVGQKALENPGMEQALLEPMKGFQRAETKGAYSAVDVMNDMLTQIQAGKDIPSGILGRWNRLFEGTGREIDMVPEAELPDSNLFRQVFQHAN